jgi:signal transduction histidine kinase
MEDDTKKPKNDEKIDQFFLSETDEIKEFSLKKIFNGKILNALRGGKLSKKELIQENSDLKAQLEKALKEKDESGDFVSLVAHDLKAPFNAILGFSDLLATQLEEFSLDEIKDMAIGINTAGNNTYQLLENLLLLRPKNGEIPCLPKNSDLSQMGENGSENESQIVKEQADRKEIFFTSNIPKHTNVFADPKLVNVILKNLISNAIKFTPKGKRITLSVVDTSDTDVVEVSVKDEGVGMTKEQVSNLFQGKTVDSTKGTENEGGTGLGLLLCQKFVERMGGKIWVESEEGKGSTFKFTLPKPKLLEQNKDSFRIGNFIFDENSTTNTLEFSEGFFQDLKKKDIPLNHASNDDFQKLCQLGEKLYEKENLEKGIQEIDRPNEEDVENTESILSLHEDIINVAKEIGEITQSFLDSKTKKLVEVE